MTDFLKYRFPGEGIVEQSGGFRRVSKTDNFEGFMVSDLKLDQLWVFDEQHTSSTFQNSTPPVLNKEEYLIDAQAMLDDMKVQRVEKVVFSRVKRMKISITENELFLSLCDAYPDALVYLIQSSELGVWIGATPERLIEPVGDKCRIMSLAGTKNTLDKSQWSDKEIHEQSIVSDYIKAVIERLDIPYSEDALEVYEAGPVKHLLKNFFIEQDSNNWSLVAELHPTPAIAGVPKAKAEELIKKFERHERGLYTGVIGLRNTNPSFFVNLRCAQIIGDQMYLYVGGGFTLDSSPESEWEETENKAGTFSRILKNE